MKVALVYPEVYDIAKFGTKRKEFPPFGIIYLAAHLERAGVAVNIYKVSPDIQSIKLDNYDVVGFSIPSSVTYPIIRNIRYQSTFSGNPLILVGGIHASLFPEHTLLDLNVDVVCIGEGENTLLEIIYHLEKRDFSSIKGICYKKHQIPSRNSPRPLIESLDSIPFPSRRLLDENDFIMNDRLSDTDLRMTHIMFSRGCPFSCYFCASPQKKLQLRSGVNVRTELQKLILDYDIQGFSVVDDNNIVNKNNIIEISNSISDLNLKWNSISRVDTIDEEILRSMKAAGCIEIVYGVESGCQKILQSMNKRIKLAKIINAIDLAYSLGVKIKIFLIHGFPGENAETTMDTINFLKEIGHKINRVSLFRFVPLPGSFVFNHPDAYKLTFNPKELTTIDWSSFHIHHNHNHWWGTVDDFKVMTEAYYKLEKYINNRWPSKFMA